MPPSKITDIAWDIPGLVKDIGGPGAAHALLAQEFPAHPVSASAVRSWTSRKSASAEWVARLLYIRVKQLGGDWSKVIGTYLVEIAL